jgi:hypothetical protein
MTNTRTAVGAVTLVLTAAAGIFFFTSSRASTVDQAGDLDVACGESHRAVVRQVRNGSSVRISVDCVSSGVLAASSPDGVLPMTTAYYPDAVADPRLVPVVYVPQPTAAPAVATRVAPPRSTATRTAAATRSSQRPSWQKRAIIIGASAGAGAGVGALIGGKKGALIGAAAGGGGAAVVDQIRNR